MRNKKVYVGATFGLMLGAAALAPVLPLPTGVANVYAAEETGTEVTTYDELYEAIVNGDASVVTLGADITELSREMKIAEGRVVTIDLNGHTLSVAKNAKRGIVNYGDLTVTGGGVIQNSDSETVNACRGIFDNYGRLTTENVTLKDYGDHTASTIRNNTADAVVNFNAGSVLNLFSTENGNVGISAAEGNVYVDDGTEITSVADYYYPIQVIDGNVVIGTVGSENPATIRSKRAAIYAHSGTLVVNNADIESELGEAISVGTEEPEVTINGGHFAAPYGGVYIYTNERANRPLVTINGGDFSGQWASIVSTNHAGDLETWAFDIKGGVYAGTRIREYISDDYRAYRQAGYFANGWAGYFVEPYVEESIPATIYMKKGTQESLGFSETAKKFATVSLDKDGVLVLDGDTITSGKTGIVKITTNLNDGSDPVETIVYSYENLLSVELVEADRFSEEEISLLDASLVEGEEKIGYLDVTYARVIDGVEIERISEVEEPVTILVEMPELPALAEGYKRSYRVLHYHEGAIEEISDVTMNEATGTVGFETSSFSPFLVTYLDTEIPVEPEDPGDNGGENGGETGGETGGDSGNNGGQTGGKEEDPKQPLIPKDHTFDFDDPADVDPLGETYTQPAAVATTTTNTASNGNVVKVPNTANVEHSSEINLLIAMMTGSVVMTAAVLGIKKRI